MKLINPIKLSNRDNREFLPIIEGGKGIGVSDGKTAGAFAKAGAVGTISGVNPICYDENGDVIPLSYKGKTMLERHNELMENSIKGGITQAQIAHETSGGNGRIHMNVLWEMGDCERVLQGVLDKAKGIIHGVTCGAGMPYKIADIAAKYEVDYYPIVSSVRTLNALWKRSYNKFQEFLGGIVYEDPWKAGGHNGITNREDPKKPERAYERVLEIRNFLKKVGLAHIPIIIAGSVWCLSEWEGYIDNPDLGPVSFQFGTRPMLSQESPISDEWKQKLLTLKESDVVLNKFSPTGFYSSAVNTPFLQELFERSERQIPYQAEQDEIFAEKYSGMKREVFISTEDKNLVELWNKQGFDIALKTPDDTMIFVSQERADKIKTSQMSCTGCLSVCKFSAWVQHNRNVKMKPDPRSFCIQKALQRAVRTSDVENSLMFSGHNGYRFGEDPFYKDGFIPTIQQLVDRIITGA